MSPAASQIDTLIDYDQSSTTQLTLDLPAPPATGETPLVPVRMVNEWVYCPRLAFLEWVDGEWADTSIVANDVTVKFKLAFSGL